MELQTNDIKYMIEALVSEVGAMLCDDGYSIPDALHLLYTSDTYRLLSDPTSKMYAQSAVYVYDCLQHELKYGEIYG